MSNNQLQHKYMSLKILATSLVAGIGGFFGRVAAIFLTYLFNYLAKKGIYFINVGSSYIETNMDQRTWEKVASQSWELKDAIDAGKIKISEAELKEKSETFRRAFRRFAVYGKVRDDGNS